MIHTSELGVGLGFPGVSIGSGFEDDVCAGFEGSAGFNFGFVGAGGSFEAGGNASGGASWTGGVGATAGPFRTPIQGGAYLTFGDC